MLKGNTTSAQVPKVIYLIRHAQYDNPRRILMGRLPAPLTEAGRDNAKRLGEYFSDKNIERIYSSQVQRCHETSSIISSKLPTPVSITYDQRLLETFSAYQGYWGDGLTTKWDEFFSHYQALGGELLTDIQKRMVSFFETLIDGDATTSIICSHGDPLYTLFCHLSGKPLPPWQEVVESPPDYQPVGTIRKIEWYSKEHIVVGDITSV